MAPLLIFVIKALYATVLGFIIGIQRESVGKPAGSRTYALVTLGATIFTIISQSAAWGTNSNPTQMASQIIVGIGFLGAGTIIFHNDKVEGLTTAAGLWVSAALGALIGISLYQEALVVGLITLLVLYFGKIQMKKGWLKD